MGCPETGLQLWCICLHPGHKSNQRLCCETQGAFGFCSASACLVAGAVTLGQASVVSPQTRAATVAEAMQAHLSRSAVLNGNSGSATIKRSSAARPCQPGESGEGASAAATESPVLVLSSRGEAVLEVSMLSRTGRMQLRLPAEQTQSLSHENRALKLLKKVITMSDASCFCYPIPMDSTS